MKASTFLMFQGQAKNALDLYKRAFPGLEINSVTEHQIADGSTGIETAHLHLAGLRLILSDSAINHDFDFTPSASLFIDFDDETSMETAHNALSEGGKALMPRDDYGFSRSFAWIQDPFGVSWQLNLP